MTVEVDREMLEELLELKRLYEERVPSISFTMMVFKLLEGVELPKPQPTVNVMPDIEP